MSMKWKRCTEPQIVFALQQITPWEDGVVAMVGQ